MTPVTLVFSIVLQLILLRYFSFSVMPTDHANIKEVSMKKTLTDRIRIFLSTALETIWAIGVGSVVSHLST